MGEKPASASKKPAKRVGVLLPASSIVDIVYAAGVRFDRGRVVELDKDEAEAALAESRVLVRAGKDA